MYRRIVRLPTADDVSTAVADQLLQKILELQETQEAVHICLTGGATANSMYEQFAELAANADLDASKLHFWWGDERFVSATDPERHSLQAIERLARTIPINSAHIHMMAAMDGRKDAHESASAYQSELGDTVFDIVLLGVGPSGHCASIFPDHPSFEPTSRLAIGVENAPIPPEDRITLTFTALNRSRYVWLFATGEVKSYVTARALAGDETLPVSNVHGEQGTIWFIDDAASKELPEQYACDF